MARFSLAGWSRREGCGHRGARSIFGRWGLRRQVRRLPPLMAVRRRDLRRVFSLRPVQVESLLRPARQVWERLQHNFFLLNRLAAPALCRRRRLADRSPVLVRIAIPARGMGFGGHPDRFVIRCVRLLRALNPEGAAPDSGVRRERVLRLPDRAESSVWFENHIGHKLGRLPQCGFASAFLQQRNA